MRQVIRYEVEVFFLKSNLGFGCAGSRATERLAVPCLGMGTPREWGYRCPVLTGHGNLHLWPSWARDFPPLQNMLEHWFHLVCLPCGCSVLLNAALPALEADCTWQAFNANACVQKRND